VGGGESPDFLFQILGEVGVPEPSVLEIPTLDSAGLAALAALLAATAFFALRRRRA
jgi:hypothetical protein